MGCCDATNLALDGIVSSTSSELTNRRTALKGLAALAGGLTLAACDAVRSEHVQGALTIALIMVIMAFALVLFALAEWLERRLLRCRYV
jgi:hypothetical protein